MRRASIQVEIIEEDGSLTLIFYGMHGEKRREPLPFATQAARRVNKNLYYTMLSILQEYQPGGTIEGSIVHEEE
ncbi:MAG: hypothetical protein J2P37_22795 [Ktedonobacteraceae bacterium]|nr:hypothetical protein [Ktedonobacteraceae bacterium]